MIMLLNDRRRANQQPAQAKKDHVHIVLHVSSFRNSVTVASGLYRTDVSAVLEKLWARLSADYILNGAALRPTLVQASH
jgi:translation initiation factor 1 (eIF-1/SUI1)